MSGSIRKLKSRNKVYRTIRHKNMRRTILGLHTPKLMKEWLKLGFGIA